MSLQFKQRVWVIFLLLMVAVFSGPAFADHSDDLTIGYIQRLPEIDYVWDSSDPAREGWPAAGQTVTWRARVLNFSGTTRNQVAYRWYLDDVEVAAGTVNIPARSSAVVDFDWNWIFERHQLRLAIDVDDAVAEYEEGNNELTIDTDAISLGLYVEQSVYDYFQAHQHKLGVPANCWENWAQRQVVRWNRMFDDAVYPETPNGVLDRIRLDKITIIADGALPLAGRSPSNKPNPNDRSVDLQWGFPATLLEGDFYADHHTLSDQNPFYYEGSLIHELGHARYSIDGYGFNVVHNDQNVIDLFEDGQPVPGSQYMPFIAWKNVFYSPYQGLMNTDYSYVDRYSAVALNLIAGQRATRGNFNAPGNIGVFLTRDLPAQNQLTIMDSSGNSLPSAQVQIYQATQVSGVWYGKYYDDMPDLELVADANGQVLLGRCPFDDDGSIEHTYGIANGTLIIRVDYFGAVGYGFLTATDFNLEYWRGNTHLGKYEVMVDLIGDSDTEEDAISVLQQAFWRGNEGWFRTVPVRDDEIQWRSASTWGGPIGVSVLPGGGDMQAQSDYVLGKTLHQTFWRGNQGRHRAVPIASGQVQWQAAFDWDAPQELSELPGSGNMQALSYYVHGATLYHAVWRGNEGWIRTIPIANGAAQQHLASTWDGPIAVSKLPGSGDMQALSNYVQGNKLHQAFWRGNQGWYRTVPIVNGTMQWQLADDFGGPIALTGLSGEGDMQAQTNIPF